VTLAERLRAAALAGPDPEHAPARIERFLAACDASGDRGGAAACVPDDECERMLTLLTSQSPYLTAQLIRDPSALARLAHDPWLGREKDAATLRAELDALAAAEPALPLRSLLRRFRNREYLRLGARELGFGTFDQVGRELSALASVCVDFALVRLRAELAARHGEPLRDDGRPCRFVVFGMGKLGGDELNFSSDIDLLYLYETDRGAAGALTLHELFARLSERLTAAISDVTDEGFCFRVDLRLRPEGTRGPVTNSLGAAERYYEAWGRPWERQAWLKARAIAGDRDLGDEALAMLAPFVWPRSSGAGVIDAVHALMTRIRAELASPGDVKLGPGGIREIEFFVQALELVHGGRQPTLRERGTLRALDKLLFAGLTSEREHRALADAYLFLRRVEHRLQLDEGRQTHAVPDDDARRALVARRLGFEDVAGLDAALAAHRARVSEIYATLGAPESAPPAPVAALLDGDRAAAAAALRELGFANAEASADEIVLLRAKPWSPFAPSAPPEVAPLAPVLLEEVAASPDPDLALRRLVDLVGRRGASATIWRLMAMHRPLARLVVSLFGTSEFLAKQLLAHPDLIEPLSAGETRPERTRAELDATLARALAAAGDDEEAQLNALRRVKNEELLRIGLFDVAGELTVARVSAQLSDLADAIVAAALDVIAPVTFRKWGAPRTPLAVVALGKLGARELTYSSDLDVVFLYGDEGTSQGGREATHFETYSRLAQRLIHALGAFLEEGRLFVVDTRLRPSGEKGALVTSLEGFRAYHAGSAAGGAQLWERQALIKARTVAGDRALGAAVEAVAAEHVYGAAGGASAGAGAGAAGGDADGTMAREIGRLRARMEKELARETAHRFDIKVGRGGIADVEFLVQYLQLRDGPRLPALRVRATADAIAALRAAGVLDAGDADALGESYAFLRRLENRLRIVHDRSMNQITDEPGELDTLARRLGYHERSPGARLLADYRRHAARVRALYLRWLPSA
jgi:[glutamine synthetase] adenylyltransferase / [glutamine synthetase]-adenylyl-L-tyrosine phosphorylase